MKLVTLWFTEVGCTQVSLVPHVDLDIGPMLIRRASHVWPKDKAKRLLYRTLRLLFKEYSSVYFWMNDWKGPWTVRWANEPDTVVFEHDSRQRCLEWEQKVLGESLDALYGKLEERNGGN